jgi:hypothetical protein
MFIAAEQARQVAGYIIGRISNGNGEIDSLAEDTLKVSKMLPAYTF